MLSHCAIYNITTIGTRTEEVEQYGETYDITIYNISLPVSYVDANNNTILMRDDDIIYYKYIGQHNLSTILSLKIYYSARFQQVK